MPSAVAGQVAKDSEGPGPGTRALAGRARAGPEGPGPGPRRVTVAQAGSLKFRLAA
jgi:hypothetical protein